MWNKLHIQRQTIAYPLFNWIYFLIVLVFVTQMSEITSSVSMRHHSTNKHLLFLYMNWYQHVFDEVTNTCHLTTLYNKSHTINMDKRIHCWLSKVISCKTVFHCWFGMIEYSSVLCKLSKLPGHFANHFLSIMYFHHYELI